MAKIDGLEVFEVEVNGDDPRWTRIVPEDYGFCNETVRTGDFPVLPGTRVVRYVLLSFNTYPTPRGFFEETARRNFSRPDRAETETVLDARKGECGETTVVGICGVVQSDVRGNTIVGDVSETDGHRSVGLEGLGSHWPRDTLFVAVVSREALPP